MKQSHARQKRMEAAARRRSRFSAPRHRAPSELAGSPGGSRADFPAYEFIRKYRVNGEWKLETRVLDCILPEEPKALIWATKVRPKKGTHYINGRSDRTARHSPGRTLRPQPDGQGGSLASGAIAAFFPGEPEPLKEHQFPPKSGFRASERSMSRPGYQAVGTR